MDCARFIDRAVDPVAQGGEAQLQAPAAEVGKRTGEIIGHGMQFRFRSAEKKSRNSQGAEA